MEARESARLDAGRLFAAGAVLALDGSRGPLGRTARRVAEGSPAVRIARSEGVGDAPLAAAARALRATALGRRTPGERAWIERIERRRAELAAAQDTTDAVFTEEAEPEGERWSFIRRQGPVSRACGLISIPPLWGRLLMRLIAELEPRRCVELGTGFGLSAAYQAAALELAGGGELTTFEGAESWARIAREGAGGLGLERLEVRVGPLSETLGSTLGELDPVDLAFVDAEHTKEATIGYFEAMLPHLSRSAVLLFDDIAFDKRMWEAWEEIRSHPRTTAWAALGRMGLVRITEARS